MDFILQVCKVEEKDLVHLCDVGKSFKYFVNSCSLQGVRSPHELSLIQKFKLLIKYGFASLINLS